jgi:hypothetical protein
MRHFLVSALLLSAQPLAYAAEPMDLGFVIASSLPRTVVDALLAHERQLVPYVLSAHINPYYLHADFDGDHALDTAIWVKERDTGKTGILIVRGRAGDVTVLGAGQSLAERGDSFGSMDAWQIYPRGEVARGADGRDPPQLLGDGLLVEKTEASSGIVYWNGSGYAWYQQGD